MAQVILVDDTGAETIVSTPRAFVDAVYGHGLAPKTGSIEDAYALIVGSQNTPSDPLLAHIRLLDLQTSNSAAYAKILQILEDNGGGGGGVSDHGALTGLGDDDHTQYLNNTRGDARYAATTDPRLAEVAGATATATANKLAKRDASGRLAVADGAAAGDAINKGQLDAAGTNTATASTLVKRDASATASFSQIGLTGAATSASQGMRKGEHDTDITAAKARANHTGTQASSTLTDLTETVQDIVAAFIAQGTGITKSYDDTGNILTISATGGGGTTDPEIVRDTIGSALAQGAGINIVLNDAGDTITISSTAVLPTRQVIAGTGLGGGGDLSADRTFTVTYGTTAGTAAQGNDSRLSNARTPTAHQHPTTDLSDSGAAGRDLVKKATWRGARSSLDAGPRQRDKLIAFAFDNTEMRARGYVVENNTFTPLPGSKAYEYPGYTQGTRDPSPIQYGGRYYMAASRAQMPNYLNQNTHWQLAVSEDLINWKWVLDMESGVAGANRNWAPDLFVDEDNTVYAYYAVSTDDMATFNIYVRTALNENLTSWSAPVLQTGLGSTKKIDANVNRVGDRYVMFVKDETNMQIMRAWADSPLGPWTLDRTGNWLNITGPVEGPQLMRLPNGKWRLYYDRYVATPGTGLLAYKESDDLDTWGAEVPLTYPLGNLRHPGYMWLSAGEWRAYRSIPRRVVMWRTSALALTTSGTQYVIPLQGGQGDPDFWSSTVNPSRLTAPEASIYTIHIEAKFGANATGIRSLSYRKNGGAWVYINSQPSSGAAPETEMSVTLGGLLFAAGDYIEFGTQQQSGGALNLTAFGATMHSNPGTV